MVHPGYPLRHTVIVGVFRLECEFEEASHGQGGQPVVAIGQAAITPDSTEGRTAVADQSHPDVAIAGRQFGRTEDGPNKIIVEVRRPYCDLALLQGQNSVMVPWGLPERRK